MPIDGRMIAGAPLTYWVGFHAVVLLLLVIDLVVLGRRREGPRFRTALVWTVFLIVLALGFAAFVLHAQGQEYALEFISGYVLEGSLSIDNLFVFLVLFGSFGLTVGQQHRALIYGVLGAIVLRALFIVAGVALLDRFAAMQYVFGTLLLYAAWRLMRQKKGRTASPTISHWVQSRGWRVSPMLLAVVAIEITDVVFAIDSVPAVLGVTHDTFIVYTSNISPSWGCGRSTSSCRAFCIGCIGCTTAWRRYWPSSAEDDCDALVRDTYTMVADRHTRHRSDLCRRFPAVPARKRHSA